jgi:ribosomal protein S18 acetylase RimI-like enzyme
MNNEVTREIRIDPLKTERERKLCAEIMLNSEPWSTLGFNYERLLDNLKDKMSEVYVMYHKTELIGLAIIQLRGPLSGYIKSIAIAPGWQNNNLGKTLMDYVEQIILKSCPNVFLCVSSFNSNARKFYLNIGYECIGELKNYVANGYSELLMRKTTGPLNEFERTKL